MYAAIELCGAWCMYIFSRRKIKMKMLVVVILLFIALFRFPTISAADSPVVKTKSGSVRGKLLQVPAARQDVYEFIGIPFAEPPIGEKRFRKPIPKTPWTGVLNATKPPNQCMQVIVPLASSNNYSDAMMRGVPVPGVEESEDCLYLNIWTPRAAFDLLANESNSCRTKRLLAVYVFIHGGGFIGGNTIQDIYNGTIQTGFNNIIFASIQYRLGSLGFAYFGKNNDAPGNAGLWDQLEALKWISENIAAFGGNSSEITLGGESAGAASVAYHILSPYSRRYFQRAIVESGTALSSWAILPPDIAMTITDIVLNASSTGRCDTRSSIPNKIRCLRSINAKAISAADKIPISLGYNFGSVPVIDGDFVPEDPRRMLVDGTFYKIPLLMGANREEGSFFWYIRPELTARIPSSGDEGNFNYTDYKELMKIVLYIVSGRPRLNYAVDPILVNAVQLEYWPSNKQLGFPVGHEVVEAVVEAIGDYAFTCPTYYWANAASRENSVFSYHFSHRSTGAAYWPEWMGVVHGDELAYVFGEPLAPYAQKFGYTNDDALLSKKMMEYWGNFVKYGDPNSRDEYSSCDNCASDFCQLQNWPTYKPVGRSNCLTQTVELNVTTQVFNRNEAVNCGLKARDCEFWTEFFPMLTRLVAKGGSDS